jgi:hypothetical protein
MRRENVNILTCIWRVLSKKQRWMIEKYTLPRMVAPTENTRSKSDPDSSRADDYSKLKVEDSG